MKPHMWALQNIRSLAGIPGQVGLRLSRHEAPIDGPHAVFFRDGQDSIKSASGRTGHELSTNDGAMITPQATGHVSRTLPASRSCGMKLHRTPVIECEPWEAACRRRTSRPTTLRW